MQVRSQTLRYIKRWKNQFELPDLRHQRRNKEVYAKTNKTISMVIYNNGLLNIYSQTREPIVRQDFLSHQLFYTSKTSNSREIMKC